MKLWGIGKFPVLRDEARNETVPESSIIVEYLDRHYRGRTRFIPDDPGRALQTRLRDRFYDLYVHLPMQKIMIDRMRPADKKDPHGVEEARAQLRTSYAMIEQQMAKGGWAMGEDFSLADCAAAPPLFYGSMVVPFGDARQKSRRLFRAAEGAALVRAGDAGGGALFPDGAQRTLRRSVEMAEASRAETIRRIFAAYLANDRKFVENALSGDFRFTSPYDDAIDKPTYFERCWKNSDWIERHELERIFVEGDEAFVTYRCVAKGGRTFRNTEFFVFEGDKVKRIDVYFGAAYDNGAFVRQPG